jgi:hypothetical protein
MRKHLHVLCYQHHTGMLPRLLSEPAGKLLYVCKEPGCLTRYNNTDGYFIDTEGARAVEEESAPRISCLNDEHPMYLAEVRPEKRSFRLWKCPGCNSSRTNEDSLVVLRPGREESSPGWVKKMGA